MGVGWGGRRGLAAWRGTDGRRGKDLPTSWSKGLVAKRGMSAACRGVSRDCPSTPRPSAHDGERRPLRYKHSHGDGRSRVLLGPSSLPPQQQRRRRQRRRSGAGPRAGRVGNPGDLSAACASWDKNPAFPPRPTQGASSTASSADLPQVPGISGYVVGFSIARASREDVVLQARRGRLSTSGEYQRRGRKEGSLWV